MPCSSWQEGAVRHLPLRSSGLNRQGRGGKTFKTAFSEANLPVSIVIWFQEKVFFLNLIDVMLYSIKECRAMKGITSRGLV